MNGAGVLEVATGGRSVSWGHWGLTFSEGEGPDWRQVASLPFPVGPQGPQDGFLGSPERERYREACRAWTERGELPEGARCYLPPGSDWNPYIPEREAHAHAPSAACWHCQNRRQVAQ